MENPRDHLSHHMATTTTAEIIKDKQLMETTRNFKLSQLLTNAAILFIYLNIYYSARQ